MFGNMELGGKKGAARLLVGATSLLAHKLQLEQERQKMKDRSDKFYTESTVGEAGKNMTEARMAAIRERADFLAEKSSFTPQHRLENYAEASAKALKDLL